tara:strand:+ start:168 stop:623 length:456 start_codon:yes stop_codon:yes gene_type:complete
MFKKTILSFALCYFFFWSSAAVSGPFTLSYTRCLVENTTGYEQETLVRWVFTSLGTHPALVNLMHVEQIERDEIDRDVAKLLESLIFERCKSEALDAMKHEPDLANEKALQALGTMATKALMNEKSTNTSMTAFTKYLDKQKMMRFMLDLR